MQSMSEQGEAEEAEVQRDPRANSASLIEEAQVDPRKYSHSSSAERFLEQSHSSLDRACGHYMELDCGHSCDYKVGSPSYLDKIAWREGKPQHYSEPKLILDLSHWKRNILPGPSGGSAEQLPPEEPRDLFQEISRWVESTQSGLHSPGSPQEPPASPCSPPLPLSPTMLPHPLTEMGPPSMLHTSDLLHQHSRRSPSPFFTSPPSLQPSSPSSPTPDPSNPFQSNPESSPQPNPGEDHSPFDLDVFISQALRLCSQSDESDASKQGNVSCASGFSDHKPSSRAQTSTPEMLKAQGCHKEPW